MNERILARYLTLALTLMLFLAPAASASPKPGDKKSQDTEPALVQAMDHAETYYWVAMAERGSLTALSYGMKYLDRARDILDNSPPAVRKKYSQELESLANDIHYQYRIAHDTLYGLFPLSRFFNPSIFANPHSTGSFELFDDPRIVAVREAVENLIEHVLESQFVIPQFDVLFVSDPHDTEIESEALYLFNLSPRFFVHNLREINRSLTPEELAECRALTLTDATRKKLLQKLGTNTILLVRLKEIDFVNKEHFFSAEGRLFTKASDSPQLVLNNYGFAIDRRPVLPMIIAVHIILILIAIPAYMAGFRFSLHGGRWPSIIHSSLITLGGFAWGRILVWMIVPIFFAMQPYPERIALWSFWWPLATGLSILFAPILAIWVAISRFKLNLIASPTSILTPVMLGSSAYFVECAFLYKGLAAVTYAIPFVVGIAALSTLATEICRKDVQTKPSLIAAVAISAVALVIGITAVNFNILVAGAIFSTTTCVLSLILKTRSATKKEDKDERPSPDNNDSLLIPENQRTMVFNAVTRLTNQDNILYLGIHGPEGCGKSFVLSNTLNAHLDKEYSNFILYSGSCPPSGDAKTPYAPFAEACKRHLPTTIFSSAQQDSLFDNAVNKVFDSVVPFSKILFSAKPNDTAGSKNEIHVEILNFLKQQTKKKKVLFVIDDFHYIDRASKELLEFIVNQLQGEAHTRIKFILLGREEASFPQLPDSDRTLLEIPRPSESQIANLLGQKFSLDADCARQLAEILGSDGENIKWALEAVASMVQKGCFTQGKDGLEWKDSLKDIRKHLPSNSMEVVSGELLHDSSTKPILQCAACIGYTFQAALLCESLGMDRLELLQQLDRIEQKTGWLQDLQDQDDHYRFRSTLVFEALRDRFKIVSSGPDTSSVPQLIREYHARLGTAYEKPYLQGNGEIYKLANQYYLAGSRKAAKAVKYCLEAAKVASSNFLHSQAYDYCNKAADYASYGDFAKLIAGTKVLVCCNEAHFEGRDRKTAVQETQAYIDTYAPEEFEPYFLLMRSLYDAAQDTRDQSLFAQCHDLAQECETRFTDPLNRAVACQFKGISLPVSEKEKRKDELEKAVGYIGDKWERDLEAARIHSKVLNSLAEQLSYGSPEDRARARELYLLSIKIKKRPGISDILGLAVSYGGLGRLSFFAENPEYGLAREYFTKDLLYSRKIGNITGIGKMHSFIGLCDMKEKKWDDAYDNFSQSLDISVSVVDKLFGLAGLISASSMLEQPDNIDRHGAEMAAVCKTIVQESAHSPQALGAIDMASQEMKNALSLCSAHSEKEWYASVRECLDAGK